MAKTNIEILQEQYKATINERREMRRIYVEGQALMWRLQLDNLKPEDFNVRG